MNKEIVLATNNKGKLLEYRNLLSPLGYVVYSPKDLNIESDPEETGSTYFENALLKARALTKLVPFPVIADDSGLEIKALGGFPGLRSARYAAKFGDDYLKAGQALADQVKNEQERTALFRCVICLIESPSSTPRYFEGICEGSFLSSPHGSNGFGYDPFFHSKEANIDFGVAPEAVKNKYSHRAKALLKLVTYLAI